MRKLSWILFALALTACDDGGDDGDAGPTTTGCATAGGPMCESGLMCCEGVPYPTEGVCQSECTARSDRALKEDVRPVDPDAVLAGLADLEVRAWRYRAGDEGARHVGPMAQDFHGAFGLGHDDTVIHQVDADGVLMLSVQALNRRLEALETDNAALRRRSEALERRVRSLERDSR